MARKNSTNPYGGTGGSGVTLPPYFKPTPYVKNNQIFAPGLEEVGPDEMRISYLGSCPWPPRRDQAATSIMVELGNGDTFFFDLGPGSVKNAIAMQKPPQSINDIFITHLHFDHWGDIPYLYPFTASMGRWNDPLRITGPDGATPELGTKATMDKMKDIIATRTVSAMTRTVSRFATGLGRTARTALPPTDSIGTVSALYGQGTDDPTSSR